MGVRNRAAILGIAAILSTPANAGEPSAGGPITWKKTTIEGKFRSEGVATADVNKFAEIVVLKLTQMTAIDGTGIHAFESLAARL